MFVSKIEVAQIECISNHPSHQLPLFLLSIYNVTALFNIHPTTIKYFEMFSAYCLNSDLIMWQQRAKQQGHSCNSGCIWLTSWRGRGSDGNRFVYTTCNLCVKEDFPHFPSSTSRGNLFVCLCVKVQHAAASIFSAVYWVKMFGKCTVSPPFTSSSSRQHGGN